MGGSNSAPKAGEAAEAPAAPAPAAEDSAEKQGLAAGKAALAAAHWKAKAHAKSEASPADSKPAPAPAAAASAAPAAPAAPAEILAASAKGKGKEGKGKSKEGKEKGEGGKKAGKSSKGKGGGKSEAQAGRRLNVKYLPDDLTSDGLKKLFEEHGSVQTAEVKTQEGGKSRGFGFVVMASEEDATKAKDALNGKELSGKAIAVVTPERRSVEGAEEVDLKGGKGKKGKGKGKDGKDGKGKAMTEQQAAAAAYMQQYHNYMLYMAAYYQQQQQANAVPSGPPSKDTKYEGSLKSLSAKKGYGFIVNMETHKLFERDVYVDKDVLPASAQIADRLVFTVEVNAKGHPRAATCEFALPK